MDRDAAVVEIKEILSFRTGLDAKIIRALQQAQRQLEGGRSLPWFLREEDFDLTLDSLDPSVSHPTGFIREVDEEKPWYTTATGGAKFLKRAVFSEAKLRYIDVSNGPPQVYAMRKDTFYFFPVPDQEYTITMSYFKKDDILTTNIENAWLENVPDLLIGLSALEVAMDLKDAEAQKKAATLFNKWSTWLSNEIAIREDQTNDDISVGGAN